MPLRFVRQHNIKTLGRASLPRRLPKLFFLRFLGGDLSGSVDCPGRINVRQGGCDKADRDDHDLADPEEQQRTSNTLGEPVRMQTDPQFIHAEPGPSGNDVSAHRQQGQAPLADHPRPIGVENQGVPQYDDQCPVFFGIPAPKTAP